MLTLPIELSTKCMKVNSLNVYTNPLLDKEFYLCDPRNIKTAKLSAPYGQSKSMNAEYFHYLF